VARGIRKTVLNGAGTAIFRERWLFAPNECFLVRGENMEPRMEPSMDMGEGGVSDSEIIRMGVQILTME
jgi:hypothetical protein